MKKNTRQLNPSRRHFLSVGAASILSLATGSNSAAQARRSRRRSPSVHTEKRGNPPVVVGENGHRFEVEHDWPKLPDKYSWQTTHNVAVDLAGNLYVIHEGKRELVDHPAIFVFDRQGRYVRVLVVNFRAAATAWKSAKNQVVSFSMSLDINT